GPRTWRSLGELAESSFPDSFPLLQTSSQPGTSRFRIPTLEMPNFSTRSKQSCQAQRAFGARSLEHYQPSPEWLTRLGPLPCPLLPLLLTPGTSSEKAWGCGISHSM